jgi:ribonucleotide reductase beta subunit family protein with ferritin-like domain
VIINSAKTDPNKILPIRYPWARQYYKAAIANNWTPEEVSMQKDVEQWKSTRVLSDAERRLVLYNLGFFSTAESLTRTTSCSPSTSTSPAPRRASTCCARRSKRRSTPTRSSTAAIR